MHHRLSMGNAPARTPALCAWLLLASILAGCATLPPPRDRPVAHAFEHPEQTSLGKLALASAPDARRSGVRLVVSGEDALGSLVALARHAQRSLDLQYYIVRHDASTLALLREVDAAAARGVRVRLLVDDFNTTGSDEDLLCFARNPNVELRVYNPFPAGRFSTLTRVLTSLTDLERINQRMHGKMFVADNAIAVMGGRNLGDSYFVQSPSSNFVDLDVIVAGPAVRRLSASFDRFWNDPLAYPIAQLATGQPDCDGALSGEPRAEPGSDDESAQPADAMPIPASALQSDLDRSQLRLRWVDVSVLADDPPKIGSAEPQSRPSAIADEITRLIGSAKKDVFIVTPYFVPGPHGIETLARLRARDVRVRVLTNSLASTDAPVVHIGYARYRPQLLMMGVELYELRSRIDATGSRLGRFGSSLASLHAKAVVVDGREVLVGSMNMDPRSEWLNTELGLAFPDPTIAHQIQGLFDDVARNSSYRVELDENDDLRWVSDKPGATDVQEREPGARLTLRALLLLLTPFAPEELL